MSTPRLDLFPRPVVGEQIGAAIELRGACRQPIPPASPGGCSRSPPLRARILLVLVIACAGAARLSAIDKNGVAPRAISLPAGPGSIQGLGESFQPQLNSGSGSYQVPLVLPRGTGGQTSALALVYNSGSGNGELGLGWTLSGVPSIRRNTDRGVPRYVDGPNGVDDDHDGQVDNPEELDTITGLSGEELVPLADSSFRAENESAFIHYARVGAGWEAHSPDGERMLFGRSAAARIEDGARVFGWCIERQTDRNGNAVDYEYIADPATPAQKYVRRIRWGQPAAYFAALLYYEEGRPDVTSSFQPGFELRTSLRLAGIDIFSQGVPAPAFAVRADLDGDGKTDSLIRRYRLEYDETSHLSLLARVTQFGADGRTAMPSLTLGYSRWMPPENVAATMIRSSGAPASGFESGSVELIDMNGDGLPDLLSTAGSQHRVALNLGIDDQGRLAWAPLRPVGNAPAIDIASDKTHLADATADGLADLLVKVSNTSFLCYDNTSRSSWSTSPFPIRNTDTWPIWPYDGASGAMSRSFDSDYSRSNDILHTSAAGSQLWLLLPGGRYSRELRFPPLTCDGQVFRFDLPGTHIADLNGDRLQDVVWIQSSRVVYFPSRGRGEFAPPIVLSLDRTLSAAEIERCGFSDVDGDGLVDLTLVRPVFEPQGVVYWLNRFDRGLEAARTLRGLPPLSAGDALRWADMNGNGTSDIVISQAQSPAGEKILVIDLNPAGKVHLLKRVENGLGLRIDMEYESSTAQMVRAAAAGAPWSSVMPVPTTLVARISEDDGLGHVFEQRFTYRDPYYDAEKQEFRGFRGAEARETGDASASGKRARLVFDVGFESPCFKGKLLSEELLGDDGKLFQRSVSSWRKRILAAGAGGREVCFAFEAAMDQFIHEGAPEGVQVRKETDYDDFGNLASDRSHGVLGEEGDELFVERTYEPRLDAWLLRLLSTETQRDGAGRQISARRFFYDARGNLELTEAWLDTDERWLPLLRQRFDAFGNVIEAIDARGSRRSIGFDALLHAQPVSETVHLAGRDLVMSGIYDLGFGAITTATDFHGQRSDYLYDALGRLVEQRLPGGAGELYAYHFGNPVSHVAKQLRLDAAGSTFDSFFYSDGYGRPLGTRIASEDGRWRLLEARSYNARKLVERSWLPHPSATPEYEMPDRGTPHEAYSYDAPGRLLETRRADGSLARQKHLPLAVEVFDGSDAARGGAPDLRRMDGLGRIITVEERNGAESYLTRYRWRATGELETIADALGNVKRFRFDSLGRLTETNDPDRGLRRYAYDDAGNVVRRVDARGQVTLYRHDAANRILEKDFQGLLLGGADVLDSVYHYDAPAGPLDFGDGTQGIARNVAGRLAWVEDASGEEHFSYDERGNIEWVLKRLRDPQTGVLIPYRTQRSHDLLNREAEVIFPDNDRMRYLRNAGGFVERIDGGPQGGVLLSEAHYAASGQPTLLLFGNGARSAFEYDRSQRLAKLRVEDGAGNEILHEDIAYDEVSNVIAIADGRRPEDVPPSSPRRRSAEYIYDELHRLIRASYGAAGALGRIDYGYDALGNLLRQSTPPAGSQGHIGDPAVNLGDLAYAGGRSNRDGRGPADPPGPHAVTTAGGRRLAYDASGNVTSLGGAALRWDFEDRLERFETQEVRAEYLRDHASRRVLKSVLRGDAGEETHYIDPAFEVKDGSPAKYAFLDGRRLARIDGMLDPTRERVQRLVLASGWNLVAAAVESGRRLREVFGGDAAVYEARGASYAPVDAGTPLPFGKPLWVHAPAARLAMLRGTVPAAVEQSSPGPLHAWPRLESFRPAAHVEDAPALLVYDARSRRWLRRDPSLPSFLSSAPEELGAARAFWAAEPVVLRAGEAPAGAGLYYHADHLGSPAALTDAGGRLIEERAHYPYGALRSRHRPAEPASGSGGGAGERWEFTGKERDPESGLVDMEARSYLDLAGVFLSPDPRYAEVPELSAGSGADEASFSAFLANPQMGNLYAYAGRNPLKHVDPSGLDVIFSPALKKSPVFQEALALFKSTREGQRILARLETSKAKVRVGAGKAFSGGKQNLGTATVEFNSKIEINLKRHQKHFADKQTLILELADTLHHELRHAEGNVNKIELAGMRKNLDWIRRNALQVKGPSRPSDPTLWRGEEVHKALDKSQDDPLNVEFRRQAESEQLKARLEQRGLLLHTADEL
jgi:RHS repeat-associated protein